MPAVKGQKFRSYSHEIKVEAVRLHLEEGWTYREIMKELGITDRHRLKHWMRKFRELGEFGLMDQRGRREEYIDKDRYVKQLKRENTMLKKCLKIWIEEMKNANTKLLKRQL